MYAVVQWTQECLTYTQTLTCIEQSLITLDLWVKTVINTQTLRMLEINRL